MQVTLAGTDRAGDAGGVRVPAPRARRPSRPASRCRCRSPAPSRAMWVARLLDQQPVADGAHDLGRLRGRRRDRDDREHVPQPGEGAFAAARPRSRARARSASRSSSISVSLVAAFIPLLFMGGIVGRAVPRVRGDARLRDRDLDRRVAHRHADDLRALSCATRAEPHATRLDRVVERVLSRMIRGLRARASHVRAAPPRADAAGAWSRRSALTVGLYIKTPKGYFPQDDTGLMFGSHAAPRPTSRSRRWSSCSSKAADIVAGGSGGRRASAPRSAARLERLGQPRPPVRQPQAARRARRHPSRRGDRPPARRSSRTSPGIERVHVAGAGRARRRPAGHARSTSSRCGAPTSTSCRPGCRARSTAMQDRAGRGRRHRPTASRAACSSTSSIDRTAAARLGVRIQDIDDALNNAFAQRQVSTIYTPAQPVPRHPGGRSAVSSATRAT